MCLTEYPGNRAWIFVTLSRNKNKDCLKARNDKQLLGICDLGADFDVYSKCASELKRFCFQATRFIEDFISFKSGIRQGLGR